MTKIELIKKIILILVVLIGLYTLLRNNMYRLPDQLVWNTNYDLFYNVFIPIVMIISAIVSFVIFDRIKYFYVAFIILAVDAIHRLSLAINHLYGYYVYKNIPIPPPTPGSITIVTNYWPSHIMLFIEVILVIYSLQVFKMQKRFPRR